jgi:GNAT superfamily N-acetyltransferase
MEEREFNSRAVRFAVTKDGKEVGHAFLYLLQNDTHKEPYGYFADINVDESARGGGVGGELVAAVIERAKKEGCYKLVATSRSDGTRDQIHAWYTRLGFKDYGKEFRMDF